MTPGPPSEGLRPVPTAGQIAGFLRKYDSSVAATARACRVKLRAMVPSGFELVYDNYNALVFGFSPTIKAGEAVLSIAVYPRWVTLFFLEGVDLPDPNRLLQGSGSQVRSIRLTAASDVDRDDIRRLVRSALAPRADAFAAAAKTKTVVKSVSAKQRPRRPRS